MTSIALDTSVMALVVAIGRTMVDFIGTKWFHHTMALSFLKNPLGTEQFGAGRHFMDIPPEWYNGFVTVRIPRARDKVLLMSIADTRS